MPLTDESINTLANLLRQRLLVIGDHTLRDTNPSEHLKALEGISLAIEETRAHLQPILPPRLRHFLEQSSYQKALEYLEELPSSLKNESLK